LQKDVDVADAATSARQSFLVAAQSARDQRAAMTPIRKGFRGFLQNTFTDPSILAEFGFPALTRQTPTADAVAGAAVKRKATRVARHTLVP
jgi:hypothetical protein